MSEEKKFREYLIDYDYCPMTVFCKPSFDDIHVVEIAALEAERAKSKKLAEALTDSTISYDRMAMIKAIKEYEASD